MYKKLLLLAFFSFSQTQCNEQLLTAIRDLDVKKVEQITGSIKEISKEELQQLFKAMQETRTKYVLNTLSRNNANKFMTGVCLALTGSSLGKISDSVFTNPELQKLGYFVAIGLMVTGMYKMYQGYKPPYYDDEVKLNKIRTLIMDLMINAKKN